MTAACNVHRYSGTLTENMTIDVQARSQAFLNFVSNCTPKKHTTQTGKQRQRKASVKDVLPPNIAISMELEQELGTYLNLEIRVCYRHARTDMPAIPSITPCRGGQEKQGREETQGVTHSTAISSHTVGSAGSAGVVGAGVREGYSLAGFAGAPGRCTRTHNSA